jgi:hypothetical protein
MTSEDDARTRLRVGGWLPPYQAFPPDPGLLTPPVVYRSHPAANVATTYELSAPTKGERRRSLAVFCAAVAGLLLIGVALTQFGGKPATPPAHRGLPLPAAPAFPPPADLPVPAAGSRSSDPAPARSASRPPTTSTTTARQQRPPVAPAATTVTTRRPTPQPTRSQPTRSQPTTSPVTTSPVAALRAGAAVSLELADAPGYRIRHRDVRARTDRIGPRSSTLERADARFVVRPGLADGSCVSFESSNYPGWFLRHRDFRIRLDRVDRTRLFDRDATFCPETRSRAGVVALRSHNYPDRFLTENRSLLGLTPATTGTATQFFVRPPL